MWHEKGFLPFKSPNAPVAKGRLRVYVQGKETKAVAKKTTKNTSGRGERDLRVRVKSARGRKMSSTLWLERQLNDPYVKRAKAEGFRGRAAYKILELDEKYRFLVPGARVVDLGCGHTVSGQGALPRLSSRCQRCR
jgi:hypothetical protein